MRKISMIAWVALFASTPVLAEPQLLWSYEKKDGIQTPESAYFDEATESFYVSNVAGDPGAKDGVGWISKISRDGKSLKLKWVDGLNAPKGMRVKGGTLWVANIDELVEIDLKTAKIKGRHPAKGAKFLNDVAVADDGSIFVSDTVASKIFRFRKNKMETFMEGPELESPNGLLIEGSALYVATWGQGIKPDWSTKVSGRLFRIDIKTKKIKAITASPLGHLDGLERTPRGGFLVSDWMDGKVFHVAEDGKSELILKDIKGAADLGTDAKNHVMVVPGMQEDRVGAYLYH